MANESGLHDINNPPKEPYVKQDFPRLVYGEPKKNQHPNEAFKLVQDQESFEAALAAGYSALPVLPEEAADEDVEVRPRKGKK